jgi:hypothetical protein
MTRSNLTASSLAIGPWSANRGLCAGPSPCAFPLRTGDTTERPSESSWTSRTLPTILPTILAGYTLFEGIWRTATGHNCISGTRAHWLDGDGADS